MPFRPKPVQPEFNDLITSLNNSRSQIQNNPLYQTVFTLIKRLTVSKDLTQNQIKDIDETLSDILAASFLTVDDESNLLVNSRREIAGPGITLDDSVPHIRKISSSGGGTVFGGNTTPIPFPEDHEILYPIETLGNWPPSTTGSIGPIGPAGRDGVPGFGIDGEPGEMGDIGFPGQQGAQGATGLTGAQGNSGPPGFGYDGEDGLDGFPGLPGSPGINGSNGAQGNSGPPGIGIDGEDGLDGFPIPGPAGINGTNGTIGRDGIQGMDGLNGEDGVDGLIAPGTFINNFPYGGLRIAVVAARVIHTI